MAHTIQEIRAAMAAKLSAQFAAWNVTAQFKPSPNPPQIDMMPGPVLYDTAMAGGLHDETVIVRATVQPGDLEDSAQNALDALVSPGTAGLKAALEADRTLGGTVQSLRVTDASEYKIYAAGGSDLVGVEFNVSIFP